MCLSLLSDVFYQQASALTVRLSNYNRMVRSKRWVGLGLGDRRGDTPVNDELYQDTIVCGEGLRFKGKGIYVI